MPFPLLSKKTGAKADRFLLFSKCDRKVWQPCCRLPARAVLRRTPPPRDVRGCRLGQTTWGTLNLGWVPLYKMIESIFSSVYHVYGAESPSSFICDVIMLLAHSNIMRGIERWVKRWTFEICLKSLYFLNSKFEKIIKFLWGVFLIYICINLLWRMFPIGNTELKKLIKN